MGKKKKKKKKEVTSPPNYRASHPGHSRARARSRPGSEGKEQKTSY